MNATTIPNHNTGLHTIYAVTNEARRTIGITERPIVAWLVEPHEDGGHIAQPIDIATPTDWGAGQIDVHVAIFNSETAEWWTADGQCTGIGWQALKRLLIEGCGSEEAA